jgi:hypothetical protein
LFLSNWKEIAKGCLVGTFKRIKPEFQTKGPYCVAMALCATGGITLSSAETANALDNGFGHCGATTWM